MAALSVVLDPSGANIQLNNPTAATGYRLRDAADWGGRPIQDIINSGTVRLEDIDGVIAAARLTRVITLPMRVKGSSLDDLNLKMSTLNFSIASASRYKPLDLVVTPSGSTKTTTYKVIGGSTEAPYTNQMETNALWLGTLVLEALPFGLGVKQTLGSSGSPLFAAAAGPGSFTVTPTAGSEGDVLADVTIIFQLTADAVAALSIGCISSNTGWLVGSDVTGWSNGSGGGTRATRTNAKYKGGAAPSYLIAAINTIEEAYKTTVSTTDVPVGVPTRILMIADDENTDSAHRGIVQVRLAMTAGGVTSYGEWVSVPAGAGNGTTTHFSQGLDMGTFVFPPGPTGSVAFSGTTTIAAQIQSSSTNGGTAIMVFDELIFLPDASSLIAEWPVTQPAANTPIRVESNMLYNNADGAPQTILVTGAHVRCRGATRYGIWASTRALSNTAGDVTYSLVKAWAEYTPRYIHLAPA